MNTSEQDLEAWIDARRQSPKCHLSNSVMAEIQREIEALPPSLPSESQQPASPSWLLTSGCLLAGIGKLSIVFHLAF